MFAGILAHADPRLGVVISGVPPALEQSWWLVQATSATSLLRAKNENCDFRQLTRHSCSHFDVDFMKELVPST